MTSPAVDAPDVTGLIELSRDPQLDLKPVILRVQTDLFLAAPIRDRAALTAFESLATGLIPTVDADTALSVARKLGPFPETPQAVLACLAARGGAVCEAVIETAGTIDPTVVEAALASGAEIRDAIAARAARERLIVAECGEDEPLPSDDACGRFDRGALDDLLRQARRDGALAADLLGRPDLAAGDLAPLWLHADPERRAAIRDAVSATAGLRPCPPAPREIGIRLTELSRVKDVPGFGTSLAEGLGLPANFLTAAPDPSARYDLLTLALRAADVSEAEAVYIFLTLNQMVARSADRVFALVQLFRSVDRATARDLLGAILDIALPERAASGAYRPYAAPDAAKPRGATVERALSRALLPGRLRQSG